jgi:23S rRNA (uracil1939-C5)-methyltransferase
MPKELFHGDIASLAFGGSGIVRDQGLVIFCPFTIPGETVQGQILKRKKNFAEGELLQIEQASPHRISPRCPHFGVCGGCQLQHMDMEAQLEAKRQWVIDALERIGGQKGIAVEPVIPSPSPYNYRRHISLALIPEKGSYRAVYTSNTPGQFIEPTVCPIFCEESDPILSQVRQVAAQLDARSSEKGRVLIMKKQGGGFFLEFHFRHMPRNAEDVLNQALKSHANWSGALCQAHGKSLKWGDPISHMEIGPYNIAYSSGAFVQNHPEQSSAIYRTVESIAQAARPNKALDLYCGIGATSILLSGYCKNITGIELNPEGVRLARRNCVENRKENVEILQGDVEKELDKHVSSGYDWVLLNPPRIGAGERVMRGLLKMRPRHIVYVSCMPPTLARDIKLLSGEGYRISRCQPYDMFPQTAHVETLVHLLAHGDAEIKKDNKDLKDPKDAN